MRFDIITLFPELVANYFSATILSRARRQGRIKINVVDLRRFADRGDRYQSVDDRPYGGGPGMLLKIEPIYRALRHLHVFPPSPPTPLPRRRGWSATDQVRGRSHRTRVILLTPAGKRFTQREAERLAKYDRLVLLSGRYEGFDARVAKLVDEELSLGDFVLAGGELPALVMVEAIARHVPGVVGHPDALREETFAGDLTATEYPQYTRPAEFRPAGKRGPVWKVPKVLLSGDHKKIASWRQRQTARSSK